MLSGMSAQMDNLIVFGTYLLSCPDDVPTTTTFPQPKDVTDDATHFCVVSVLLYCLLLFGYLQNFLAFLPINPTLYLSLPRS
jgi:hypothetical protein